MKIKVKSDSYLRWFWMISINVIDDNVVATVVCPQNGAIYIISTDDLTVDTDTTGWGLE